jgi:hypothetical protein
MKKIAIGLLVFSCLTSQVFAATPPIDFTGLGWPGFNGTATDNTSFGGIGISGFTYNSTLGTYRQDRGFLWLRNNPNDHGLGYCSNGESCGATNTTGNGDANELSNNNRNEIIRLTRQDGRSWSDIWVSSLDTGGTNSNETGTIYWSNTALPVLSGGITFSHTQLGSAHEGSLFTYLVANGLDVNANYLFFRAGSYAANGSLLNGTNNDYLVWGVGVAAIPEPEIYAMLAAGLGLMGFVARRRKQRAAAA